MLPHAESNSPPVNAGNARKPRKSRGRGLRTTTGCTICRKRHTKCDEQKPICGPCAKGNRPCVYGSVQDNESTSEVGSQSNGFKNTPSIPRAKAPDDQHWLTTPGNAQTFSPQSNDTASPGKDADIASLRWFGLLAGDAAATSSNISSPSTDALGITALSPQYQQQGYAEFRPQDLSPSAEDIALQNASLLVDHGASKSPMTDISTADSVDERAYWRLSKPIQLKHHEHGIFQRYVTGVSLWIDLFDPLRHFSTLVPHLALQNEGLMKAVLALGSRYISLRSMSSGEAQYGRHTASQYYLETLEYLQSAMRYTSYKTSLELLVTVMLISTYEMIDGPNRNWERHLKGVHWIQRSRDITPEMGGIEGAIWWAWLRQDVWAAFRERRCCFSSFNPPDPCEMLYTWDVASQVVWLLAQAVNYSSDIEKQAGHDKLADRILGGNRLLSMLDKWKESTDIHFQPLPLADSSNQIFQPLWFHPSAMGTSLQIYCMARILLLIHQPAAGGYLEYLGRDRKIQDCVDIIGGVASKLDDEASRFMSTQCLFAAGLYCTDESKREGISQLLQEHSSHIGWPSSNNPVDELRMEWAKKSR